MSFKSYFWNENQIVNESTRKAFEVLVNNSFGADEKIEAFNKLLENSDSQSLGISFDHYFYENAQQRFGKQNIYSQFDGLILEKARQELKRQSISGLTNSGEKINGANHAGALNILALLGEETDVPLIVGVLSENDDESVVWAGCMAASKCLINSVEAYPLLFAILERVVENPTFSEVTKTEAILALAENNSVESENMMVKLIEKANFPTNVYAAIRLGERNYSKHKNLIIRIAENLPQNALYPAGDLIELIEENEEADN